MGRHYIYYRAFQNSHYYLVEIMNDPGQKQIHVNAERSMALIGQWLFAVPGLMAWTRTLHT